MSFKKEVITSLARIDAQLGVNTQVLTEHHKRSTQLEERVKPLEDSAIFFNKLAKAILAIAGIAGALASAYSYLFR